MNVVAPAPDNLGPASFSAPIVRAAIRFADAHPPVQFIQIAGVQFGVLVTNRPRPPVHMADGREGELSPKSQGGAAQVRRGSADAAEFERHISRKANRLFWDQARSCGNSNQIPIVSQPVERLASEIRSLPRPHLVIPRDQAAIKISQVNAVERNEGINQHFASRSLPLAGRV